MEPYREDQPWIRFNPDAMKQSLLETILSIPGARALKHYHDNPESSAGGKFGRLHTEGYGLGDAFNNVYKPLLLDEAIRNKRLSYNYKAASGRTIEEGRRATKEDPKYKTVDELYKIILDLPTKK